MSFTRLVRERISFALLLFCLAATAFAGASAQQVPFSWDNATVYFAMTDRFANGDSTNDHSYGRGFDGTGTAYPLDAAGHFHGGDLAGLTEKIRAGYFSDLGISAIWISPPFEQVHGWVGSDGGRMQMYAYHGYWILDFTELDANWGSEQDFRTMIDTAHNSGLRVIVDVVLNHPGYSTLAEMDAYSFGVVDTLWRSWRPGPGESWDSYHDRFVSYQSESDSSGWDRWWGRDWIRSGLPGHQPCGSDDRTLCLASLPDFRTDGGSGKPVELPPLLKSKWSAEKLIQERRELDRFFSDTGYPQTPPYYLIKWLTDWVREFGIDGFRIDTAKHVAPEVWATLISEAHRALGDYRSTHGRNDQTPFWTVAEIYGYTPGQETAYQNAGFDSVINFELPYKDLSDVDVMDSLFTTYALGIADRSTPAPLSFISSHDAGLSDRSMLRTDAIALSLLPGPIQLLYGDESGRSGGSTPSPEHGARTPMNWDSMDHELLEHWQKLLQFRRQHPSIGAGDHERLGAEPYTFRRSLSFGTYHDEVVVVLSATGRTRVNVGKSFPDDALVRDAYSGRTSLVTFGMVTLEADPSGIMLLEVVK